MKAMVLAAGLGTRLRPLTDHRPKALAEINGNTLLEVTLTRLRRFGVTEVIVNVHHFAGMIADYLTARRNFGMRIEISHEDRVIGRRSVKNFCAGCDFNVGSGLAQSIII